MPMLSNQRHEAFARAISRGEAASRAYGAVYHTTGNVAESAGVRLLRNVQVAQRVAELKGGAAERTEKTVASLVADLDEAIIFARQCNNPSAVVSAITAQAKLLGLESPRQLEVMHRPAPLPTKVLELTVEEWTAQFSTRLPPPAHSRLPKPLKQFQEEKQLKTLAVDETGAERSIMAEAPTCEPGVIYLDDEP